MQCSNAGTDMPFLNKIRDVKEVENDLDSIPQFSEQHAVYEFEVLSPYECFTNFSTQLLILLMLKATIILKKLWKIQVNLKKETHTGSVTMRNFFVRVITYII